jgi:hypothetical protein
MLGGFDLLCKLKLSCVYPEIKVCQKRRVTFGTFPKTAEETLKKGP